MSAALQNATGSSTARFMRTPSDVDIEITSRCNLRCRYCYFFNNDAVEYWDLPTKSWLQFFDELGTLGVMRVTVAGGEPFIRDDLPELLDGIVRNRMRFSLLSNGGLIDDDIAAFIAGTGRCEFVQVSVDGSCAAVHDSCRGVGAFDGAVRGIRILQRHGLRVAVRVTIHRDNVNDLDATTRFLLEDLGLPSFSTNSAGYLGTCCKNAENVLLNIEERKLAMETILRLTKEYPRRIAANAGPLADVRMWTRMEEARAQDKPAFHNGGHLTACGCPSHKISVRADGAIVPCNMLNHVVLGHVNRDSLAEIWQNNPELNKLRDRSAIPLTGFEFCAGCSYVSYCTGNCPGLAYSLTGEVDHPSPDACLRKFLNDGGTLP